MKIGRWARLMLAAAPLLAGCGDFWQASTTASFTLSNSGNMTVSPGSTGTSTITVTPASSFTGTVALTCSVTTTPSSATNPTTCSLSPASVTISGTTAQTSTLTASTQSSTTTGAYDIQVTGISGSLPAVTTTVCVEVAATSGTCSATASNSGNFYILSKNSIAGYSISGGTTLTSISGSSYTVSGVASSVAVAPSNDFLYVASTGGITLYTINTSTGALTQGSSGFGDGLAQAIQIDPSGKWLLEASLAGSIIAYPITSTGVEDYPSRSVQTMPLAAATVNQMAISPNGTLIAVALGDTGTEAFPFTSSSASPIGNAYSKIFTPYGGSGGSALSVAIDPQNRLLYVGETDAFPSSSTDSGGLRVFTISSGSLNELSYKAPYPSGGLAPLSILPTASGTYVYVGNGMGGNGTTYNSGNITGFAVSTSGLTLGSTVAAGAQPVSLAEDSTGSYIFEVGSAGSPYFDAYSYSSSTGTLNSQLTSTTGASSIAIVAVP